MAKHENTTEVTGGLTTGLEFTATTEQAEGENKQPTPAVNKQTANPLTKGYQQMHKGKMETRSSKVNILIKPSTAQKLEDAVNNGTIKSRNDLINYLLEKYFEEQESRS